MTSLRQRQLRFVAHYAKAMETAAAIVEHAERYLSPQRYWRMEQETLRALHYFERGGQELIRIFDQYGEDRPPSTPPPTAPRGSGGALVPFRRRSRPPRKS